MRCSVPIALLALARAAFGCSSADESKASAATGGGATTADASSAATGGGGSAPSIGGDRPVTVYTPKGLLPGHTAPLVVMLHGYGVDGAVEEIYLELQPEADARTFFYAHPNGTIDKKNEYFWNATDACCNYDGSKVDDSAYLASVIRQIEAAYPVDPKRVFLVGHSNGGFMAYRMACDHADLVAAIGSLAGAMWEDTSRCKPTEPVSVAEIHGTADTEVIYDGSTSENYPGAETSVLDWAKFDGCNLQSSTQDNEYDLVQSLPGKETNVETYAGCRKGTDAELWTIPGGTHILGLTQGFRTALIDYFYAHPKP